MIKVLIFHYLFVVGQVFVENFEVSFADVVISASAYADIDGDSDLDVLICGSTDSQVTITKLYINDGRGKFIEDVRNKFAQIGWGSIAFSDLDGDQDQDLIISGFIQDSQGLTPVTSIYTNNGDGIFIENGTSIVANMNNTALAFADIDGDRDNDLLISGATKSDDFITKLYRNNGKGQLFEVSGFDLKSYEYPALAFADVDGDLDMDFLIGGGSFGNSTVNYSDLYFNDGSGNFTIDTFNMIKSIEFGNIVFSDFDNDSDLDLFISGVDNDFNPITTIYFNNGQGHFTEAINNEFVQVLGRAAASDLDMDGDIDLIVSGFYFEPMSTANTNIYYNDRLGQFRRSDSCPFGGSNFGSISIADFDSDNDPDVLITGMLGRRTRYYENTGTFPDHVDTEETPIYLYPNPTINGEIEVEYHLDRDVVIELVIHNLSGQILKADKISHSCGSQVYKIDVRDLLPGYYVVTISAGSNFKSSRFIIGS